MDGGNRDKIVEGDNGGRLEAARDLADCIILGQLKDIHNALGTILGGIEGEAIGEDGEDEGVEDTSPISIVETFDQIAKNAKAANGRVSMVSHDGGVVLPLEFMMDEDAKVMDDLRTANAIVAKCVREADICDCATDMVSGDAWGEGDEFRLVQIGFEAVPSEPTGDLRESHPYQVSRGDMCDSTSEDGTVVNVHVETSAFPCGINEFEEGGCEKSG